MKNNLPFDDLVKDRLGNYSPEVPDRIWENIIAKRKSRPKVFWMSFSANKFLLLSIAVIIAGGAYFLTSGKNSVVDVNTRSKTENPSQLLNNQAASTNTGTSKSDNTTITKPSENNNGKPDSNINEDKIVEQQTIKEPTILSQATIKKRGSKIVNVTSGEVVNSDVQTSSKENVTPENAGTNNNNIFKSISQKNDQGELEKNLFTVNSHNSKDLSANKNVLSQKNYKFPDCPSIEKNAAGNKTYWEIYGGPDHAFGNYKTFGDTASNNYLQKRKESTKSTSAFSAGVRYTKVFNNGMSARTGLNYSQINEKFKYINPSEIRYVTVITTRVIIRSPGDTLYLNDTLQYQVTGTRAKTTYNRYRSIDVPLVIGYELGNGKIHANINAGVIINIYSWYKGDVLDSSYQPVSITTGKNSSVYQFKNNIGVGFLGSASIYYKLNERLHLLLEPYFRYNLSPMSKDNLNLQQKFHTAGIRAGIRLDLK